MVRSLAILQAAPSWWRWRAKENQGLPEHCEGCRYRLRGGSYPRRAAWQMALRCFAKCPCRAHWWGIYWGAEQMIWHYCEKLDNRYRTTTSLDPINLAPLLEVLTKKITLPKPAIYGVKLASGLVTEDDMLPNGLVSCSVTSVAIPSRDGSVWQSAGASLWVYRHRNHRTSVRCWWFSVQPLFHTNSLSVPSRPEHSRSWRCVLFRRAPMDWPGIKVPVAACLWKIRLTMAWVRLTWPTIAFCCISSRVSANTPCLTPIGVGRHY